MAVSTLTIPLTLTSASGSAISSRPICGVIRHIHLNFEASTAGTTDTTLATTASPSLPILTITDSATSAWYHPMEQADGNTGSALTGVYIPFYVNGYLTLSAAQSTSGKTITATIYYEES